MLLLRSEEREEGVLQGLSGFRLVASRVFDRTLVVLFTKMRKKSIEYSFTPLTTQAIV